MCSILAEVLSLHQVSINDNFFKLGGNSILAVKLVNKINKIFDVNVNISEIFQCNTVKKITDNILLKKEYLTSNYEEWDV